MSHVSRETFEETIFALASARGKAGVSVVRVSGKKAGDLILHLTGEELPTARRATLRTLVDPLDGSMIDKALLIWFPAPNSFTGEDVAEFHLHGGPAIQNALFSVFLSLDQTRIAEPGEFTRRAFANDRMDLTEAEGLADLIDAQTAAQRKQALRQMDGALGALYETWRHQLIGLLAHLEADIDFPDEDLPDGLAITVKPKIEALRNQIEEHLSDNSRGERIRDGFHIVILGAPNVGKSSLLNHLARRDVAIVTEEAGTTRDMLEVSLDLNGYPVVLVDTAGLRDTDHMVEKIGIERARARAAQADLKIAMIDASRLEETYAAIKEQIDENTLVLLNKQDVEVRQGRGLSQAYAVFPISVRQGLGLDSFLETLGSLVEERLAPGETPGLTRLRHRRALEDCCASMLRFEKAAATGLDPELAAEDIRLAARELGRITGRIDVEDVLDVVFGDFCIGK